MANFMDESALGSRQTWRNFCDQEAPVIGPKGVLVGPWAEAIVAAVQVEKRGESRRYSDGPCGQVLEYLWQKGYTGHIHKAAEDTEAAAKSGALQSAVQRRESASRQTGADPRPVCKFGPSCYQRNPEHLREFAHPWRDSAGASGPSAVAASNGGGGGKGGSRDGKPSPSGKHSAAGASQMQMQCGKCQGIMLASIPAGTAPGSIIQVQCPTCGQANQAPTPLTGVKVVEEVGARPAPSMSGRAPKASGRQRALLIGVNYFGTRAQLRGCINDVKNLHSLLTREYGWDSANIRTLTDDNRAQMPTRANITENLRWLAQGARPGDVLFLSFSGHGAQEQDPHGYEEDGMNETILPVDFERAGQITDDEIAELVVRHLPEGVKLTCVMDSCHSGTGLDLPYTWTGRKWKEETNPYHCLADVQMFSGCEDDDCSSDASNAYGAAGGALTTALCDALRSNPCPTYPQLMNMLHQNLRREGFSQRPQLTTSQPFEFDRPFLLGDIIPNMNAQIGRIFRRKFPPRPRKMEGPLANMLGIGAAVVGGMILGDMVGDVLGGLFFG